MIFQLNLAATIAVAGQFAWKKAKPIVFRDVFLLPIVGFLGIILLWWIVALANHELMPTPPEALIANLDYILNPFYERGPGNLGIGWLLLASLRRVLLGFGLGALVAIPLGFLIGMSRPAMLAFNPIIQIFKPVSPLAWLPISLAIFNLADPSAIFVIFIPNNIPQKPGEHSTFLWRSRSLWLMTQAARWGQIKEIPKNADKIAAQGWRTDLYRDIAAEMGIQCPQDDYKVEPPEVFIDKKGFDPSDPVGYLNSFSIRANAPDRFFMS